MADAHDIIFDSAPSNPDDDFWLEHGKKMVGDAITAVREAAKALLTGLGLHGLDVVDLQGLPRSAKQAGLLGDLTRFDEFTRHLSNLITLPMSRAVAFAFAQYECICTISGIHSAPPRGVAWLEPGGCY